MSESLKVLHIFDKNHPKGGLTVVYTQACDGRGLLVKFSVSVCSPKDAYTKSIGRMLATKKFEDGHYVELPLGSDDVSHTEEHIRDTLYASFALNRSRYAC